MSFNQKSSRVFLPILLILISQGVAAKKHCPDLKLVSDFDAEAFSGRWYEINRTESMIDRFFGTCTTLNFTVNHDSNITLGLDSIVKEKSITIHGSLTAESNAVFKWSFVVPGFGIKVGFQFYVLDTDYTNFAVTFVCGTIPMLNKNIKFIWISGRNRTLNMEYSEKAFAALEERNQSTKALVPSIQTGCTNHQTDS